MNRLKLSHHLLTIISLIFLGVSSSAQTTPSVFNSGLVWRNIGPFRGGRVSAVTGVVGQPGLFYMGLPAGGVWRTTGAGTIWEPIFDSVKECSVVGAIEVAPSDPRVIYVGMGDQITGGGICRGNGLYKSVDAGATWKHIGLADTVRIPSILVDPHDPNIVMVAALGDNRVKSESRGLYRSTDGGATWTKTLYVDDEIGIQKLAYAYDNPSVVIASTVRTSFGGQGRPGAAMAGAASTGPTIPGTRIFKSTDEGVTWNPVKGTGLPSMLGRTSLAIAMHTNSQRMFVVGNFGLYRSDDGGDNWTKMAASDRRIANGQGGYNCGVAVDPQNPDVVYVLSTCSYKSTDGGKTFTGFKGAPGGDDPQHLWIDPTDGKRMLMGVDQGATISLDGGLTWSSWYNQASAQVYHISVDNQFPYWVYGTQQDSGTVGTASRGNLGAITPLDWTPHPGFEFGSVVIDPLNPKISYANGQTGGIIKTSYPSGQWIDVGPTVGSKIGLRHVLNQPLIFSPTNPKELLAGFQFVMSTTDGGVHWRKISPDLTVVKGSEPVAPPAARPGGRPSGTGTTPTAKPGNVQPDADEPDLDDEEEREAQRGGGAGAIESISISTVDGKIIWVGTSNGQIRVTRDHGNNWDDVTIPDLPFANRSNISSIDASHQEIGTAYAAVDCHNAGDYKPYIYRTKDFGKTWNLIVNGLPTIMVNGSWARVVRADTVRSGLLFAGTESFVYTSLDDGEHWQSLALNLPNTSYRDMVVKNADLVVGTYGRSFWILDDISPLRQASAEVMAKSAYLFKPAEAIRVRRNVNGDTPFPPELPHAINPPAGAIIYYQLNTKPMGDIAIDIRDAKGNLVRHMTSAVPTPLPDPPQPIPDFWIEPLFQLPVQLGLNRTNWNLRYENPVTNNHSYEINANPGETPASPEGPLVSPGTYTVTLTVDGKASTQSVMVKNDPRSPASASALRSQCDQQVGIYNVMTESKAAQLQLTKIRAAVEEILKAAPPAEVEKAGTVLSEKLLAIAGSAAGGRRFGGGPPVGGGAAANPTFSAINGRAISSLNVLDPGDMAPTDGMIRMCDTVKADMKTAQKNWTALRNGDLAAFNKLLVKNGLKPIPDGK